MNPKGCKGRDISVTKSVDSLLMKLLSTLMRSSHPCFRKIAKVLGKCFLKQNASPDIDTKYTLVVPRTVEVQSLHEERIELYNRLGWYVCF